ncbi:MAG: ABC transporter permease [Victivallaceae bacterium]|nr:ABC transporter permease [Victivallaceae bacterium]
MSTDWFLAGRYLKVRRNAVSWITLTSVVGVTLGVAVLMIVLAVMTGFTDLMKSKLVETQAHFQVLPAFGRITDRRAAVERTEAAGNGEVVAAPVIIAPVLVQYAPHRLDPRMTVMAFDSENDLPRLAEKGRFRFDELLVERLPGDLPGRRGVVVSAATAREWGVAAGDKIYLHSAEKLTSLIKLDKGKVSLNPDAPAYLPEEFVVRGIYSAGKYDFDRQMIFLDFDDAADLFGYRYREATLLLGWGADAFNQRQLLASLREKLPAGLVVRGWEENNRQLLGVLAVEKRMMFFLLIFIVLVAAFSIANTLITSVFQKTREIGVLKAIGASDGTVRRIFLLQGFLIGVIGSGCGILFGWLVIRFRNDILHTVSRLTGSELFPKEFYYFNELPAKILASDVLFIVAASVLLCTLGALIPAMRAARLDPAKALRYE